MKARIFFPLIFFLFSSGMSFSQEKDEFFHEIEISHTYINNDKWRGAVAANWKHIYDEIGWRRWGADIYISRKIKSVAIESGITVNYTFDQDIVNYWDLRPWLGLRSDLKLNDRFLLMQKFKIESRNLYFDDSYKNEHLLRSRYLLSLRYNFLKDKESWKLNPTTEWYFIDRQADAERFVNSVEFGLRVIKVFENENELAFGYKIETFKKTNLSENSGRGHIIIIEYGF